MIEPHTKAGRRLALWLADADIRWPDDSTRIGATVLTDAILAIEAEAAAIDISRTDIPVPEELYESDEAAALVKVFRDGWEAGVAAEQERKRP